MFKFIKKLWTKNAHADPVFSNVTKESASEFQNTIDAKILVVEERLNALRLQSKQVVYGVEELHSLVGSDMDMSIFSVILGMLSNRAVVTYYMEVSEKESKKYIGRFDDLFDKRLAGKLYDEIDIQVKIVLI